MTFHISSLLQANQENQNFVNADERSNTHDPSRTQLKQDKRQHQQDQLKQDRNHHHQDQLKQDKKHHHQDQLKQDKKNHHQDQLKQDRRNHQQDQPRQQDQQQSMQGQHNNPARRPDRDQASLRMEEPDLEESSADFFIPRYKKVRSPISYFMYGKKILRPPSLSYSSSKCEQKRILFDGDVTSGILQVHGWEKGNAQVKELGKLLTSRHIKSFFERFHQIKFIFILFSCMFATVLRIRFILYPNPNFQI